MAIAALCVLCGHGGQHILPSIPFHSTAEKSQTRARICKRGAKKSIPQGYVSWRGPVRQPHIGWRSRFLGIDCWAPLNVNKFGLRVDNTRNLDPKQLDLISIFQVGNPSFMNLSTYFYVQEAYYSILFGSPSPPSSRQFASD